MKFEFSNILGYIGWALLIFLTFYVLLKVLGLIHFSNLEELVLGILFTQIMLTANLQSKIGNLEFVVKNHEKGLNRVERKIEKLEKSLQKK